MSEIKKEKKPKQRKKLSRSAIVLIVGLIIIAIPIIIFLSILGISALHTGTPRDGSRFEGDLDPAITEENVAAVKADLETLGSIDSVEVICSEGQLKIYIDTNDNLSEAQVDTILTNAYSKVNSKLPVSTYFTSNNSKKMYDLQINVYTSPEASPIGSANPRQYKLLHKNSYEETYQIDNLAQPKDPALAAELEGLETPTEISGTDVEEDDSDIDTSNQ
ncbi:MAG: hypothetical protein J6Z03_02720 [Erysipelotrichaceae bacterium]|nr:hypothetical protein [Erysipelotrichaceae bacterium]